MENRQIGIGIIGAGKAGRNFALALRTLPGVSVRWLCAAHAESAEAAARELDVRHWTADYHAVIKDPQVEAVIVASPDEFHCAHVLSAINAGKHVLCEKPMCRSVEEADRMIRAAQDSAAILMVGFTERYAHPFREAKKRIDGGEIGRPKMILARRCHPRSVVRGRSWLNDRQTGGVLHFAGTHNIDLICWFMGSAPERVYAEMGPLVLQGLDFTDCAVMTFRFPGGAVASLYETFAYPAVYPQSVDRSLEILGERGVIRLDFMAQPLSVFGPEGHQVCDSVTWPASEGRVEGAILAEVEHFLDCVRTGRRPLTGGEEGKMALRIADAARQAAESGRAVPL